MNVELVSGTAEWDGLLGRNALQNADARFALLVERQSQFVFRIAYAVLRNVEDAEDVVQDTFFKLFRNGAWKGISDERAFLARMVWRLAVAKRPGRRSGWNGEACEPVSAGSSPEAAVIEAERNRTMQRLIDGLPERLRRPLALSSVKELTTAQIADAMDLPEGTVRRLLRNSRKTVAVSSAPPKVLANSSAVWRRASAPFAL